MEGSAEHDTAITQDSRVHNETGEIATSSGEKQSEEVSNAKEKPYVPSAINDLTTGGFILDKVFVIVRKARFKGVWHNRDQYSVSIEVIDGGCGPASMFTSSTVNDLDTCINEHSLLLYKRVKHNDDVADGPKLKISLNKSSGYYSSFLRPKRVLSKTIPVPSPGTVHEMAIDVGDGDVVDLLVKSDLAENRFITKEQYDDFEYNQLKHVKLPLKGGEQGSCSYKHTPGHEMVMFWIPGRNDYLMHPHVVEVLTDIGIDVFSIDLRRCGRAKLPDQDPLISHHTDDLTAYIEEIDMVWDLAMKISNNGYKKIFFYGHSTGGLIVSMYHRKGTHGSKIDALVFNSPFFALNLPKVVRKAVSLKHSTIGLGKGLEPVSKGGEVNQDLLSIWSGGLSLCFLSQYYYESGKRLPYNLNLTKGWVSACVEEQKSLQASPTNNGTPTLILTSRHDHTLNSQTLLKKADHVSTFRTEIELTYARHDVFLSPFVETNKEALGYLRAFLIKASNLRIKF